MKKILVIEDEQDIRDRIFDILLYEGYQPLSAEHGQAGIALAKKERPDLIVCDVLMPGISGYGVLEALRRDPLTITIPFIFLTAMTTKKDLRHGMELGADDYLTKPFETDDLLTAIRTRLEKQAAVLKPMEDLRSNLSIVLPHEFRTPLVAILGITEMLLQADRASWPGIDEMIQLQEFIHNGALRLQRLIENYLLYAKLRLIEADPAKRKEWQGIEPLETNALIISVVKQKFKDAGRQSDLRLDAKEAQLCIVAKHLQKIVEELLDNALKFSEPGDPVYVASGIEGDRFILRITDQGRGMNQEQLAQIGAYMQFERQYYEQQGVGLGLILCRLLAQLHGGDLSIDSTPQQGTTVEVRFERNG